MTTSEPTTGEIVRALRFCATTSCEKACPRFYTTSDGVKCAQTLMKDAATTISALTARAEQAEAREKAAIAFITRDRSCTDCIDKELSVSCHPCRSCWGSAKKPNFRYSGIPQNGEQK